MNYNNNKKGFTLVELLIVIAIIGILAGIVIVQLQGSTGDASETVIKKNVQSAEGLYAQRVSDVKDNNYKNLSKDFCNTARTTPAAEAQTDLKMKTILQTIFRSVPYAVSTTDGLATVTAANKRTAFDPVVFTSDANLLSGGTPGVALAFSSTSTPPGDGGSTIPSAGCVSSAKGWVIWARTNTDATDNTYCRDSNGSQGEITLDFTAAHEIDDNGDVTCGKIQ